VGAAALLSVSCFLNPKTDDLPRPVGGIAVDEPGPLGPPTGPSGIDDEGSLPPGDDLGEPFEPSRPDPTLNPGQSDAGVLDGGTEEALEADADVGAP
jgi:hypothetical protein